MSLFQWYVYILGSQIHVLSIGIVSWCLLVIVVYQREHPFLIRVINSILVVLLGHFIYEDIFILIMGTVGRSVDAIGLYILITIGIGASIIILDGQYPSFELDENAFLMIFGLLGVFAIMYYIGWFHKLQLWYLGQGPDPHNFIWALSKVLGFACPVPLLKADNLKSWWVFK